MIALLQKMHPVSKIWSGCCQTPLNSGRESISTLQDDGQTQRKINYGLWVEGVCTLAGVIKHAHK